MVIGINIKKLREIHNLSQKELAEIAGVSDKAVSTWENGIKEPRMGTIQKIADHFGILKSDIIEDKELDPTIPETQIKNNSNSVMPLLGSIAAGIPLEMIAVEEYINVPIEITRKFPKAFLLRINGDSMNKVVPENALVLIDPSLEVSSGDIGAVVINGYEATLKRVFIFQDGITLEPESFNSSHKTQFFSYKEIEHNPVFIKGKLVWYMAPINIKF